MSPKLQAVVRKPLRWCEVTCRLTAGYAPAGKVVLQSANGQAQSSAVLGLIGGELKRFSVLCGIARGSSILILDEPTSSLDSFAALCVMRALRQLAAAGHTIIASIHQPPPSIWNLLDEVVLLSSGRTMYTGCPTQVENWFSLALGYPYQPRLHGTVCEWLLQLVTTAFTAELNEPRTMTSVQDIHVAADAWAASNREADCTEDKLLTSCSDNMSQTRDLLPLDTAALEASMHSQPGHQVLQVAAFLLPNQDLAVVGAIAYMVLAFQLGGFFRANADMIAFCRGLGSASSCST
ncbi:hypothetical protein ABBQ38_008309 [Trebouxia sp. C0009 RCD-2024]